jgi:hypothetical protein
MGTKYMYMYAHHRVGVVTMVLGHTHLHRTIITGLQNHVEGGGPTTILTTPEGVEHPGDLLC